MKLEPSSAIVRIDAKAVARAVIFAARKDIRFYLLGVCIRPRRDGSAMALGTNGHVLGIFHDLGGRAEREVILPLRRSHIPALKKSEHVLVSADGEVWLTDKAGTPTFIHTEPLIEADYPKTHTIVLPPEQYRRGLAGVYNPEYVALVHAAAKVAPSKYQSVRFYESGLEGSAALATISGVDGLIVLMGMRGEPNNDQLAARIPEDLYSAPDSNEASEAVA